MPIKNYTTSIEVSKSMGDITGFLARRGVTRISTEFDENGQPSGIGFTMKTEYGFRDFALPIRSDGILKALIAQKVEPRYRTPEHAAKVAWRVAKEWLEVQATLIDAELFNLEEVMLPFMIGDAKGSTFYGMWRATQKAIEK